jgi:hypothetical protein
MIRVTLTNQKKVYLQLLAFGQNKENVNVTSNGFNTESASIVISNDVSPGHTTVKKRAEKNMFIVAQLNYLVKKYNHHHQHCKPFYTSKKACATL